MKFKIGKSWYWLCQRTLDKQKKQYNGSSKFLFYALLSISIRLPRRMNYIFINVYSKVLSCIEISLSLLFFYIQISSFKWPKANPWKLHFIVTSLSQRYLRIPEKCKLQRNGRQHFWILVSKLLCAWCHSSCCASRTLSSTSPFAVSWTIISYIDTDSPLARYTGQRTRWTLLKPEVSEPCPWNVLLSDFRALTAELKQVSVSGWG